MTWPLRYRTRMAQKLELDPMAPPYLLLRHGFKQTPTSFTIVSQKFEPTSITEYPRISAIRRVLRCSVVVEVGLQLFGGDGTA